MIHRSQLVERFARVCTDRPNDIAIRSLADGVALTFDDVWRDFSRCRLALRAEGVGSGSVVASVVGNRPEFVTTLLAALDNGAVVLSVDPSATRREVVALAERFGVAGVIAPPGTLPDVASTTLPRSQMCMFRPCREPAQLHIPYPAVLKITSGSAGTPKAVLCTEDNLVADGHHILEAMEIGPGDINLGVIPISHSYGLGNLLMPLILQGTGIALRPSFVPSRFVDDVRCSGATVFPGVPFMFDHLCRQASRAHAPGSLRLLISAAAPIPHRVVEAVKHDLDLKVHSFYGTSETGGIAYDDGESIDDPVPMGRALPGVSLALSPVFPETRAGQVFVRSRAVAVGYVDGLEMVANTAFCDGGFLTGDIGYFDEDDRLVLTGRSSGFVNVAGRKIHPEEVERVLHQMEQVDVARVIGVACETRGEALVACIVPSSSGQLNTSSIRRHCVERLAAHKIPRHFVFFDALPIDHRGKTDVQLLKTLVVDRMREKQPGA